LLDYALAEVQKHVIRAFVRLRAGGKMNCPHASCVILGCRYFDLAIFLKIALVSCNGDDDVIANLKTTALMHTAPSDIRLHIV
jgi:hypothetical protein